MRDLEDSVNWMLETDETEAFAKRLAHELSTDPILLRRLATSSAEGLSVPHTGTLVEALAGEFAQLAEGKARLELHAVEGVTERGMRVLLFGADWPRFSYNMEAIEYNPMVTAACVRLMRQGQFGDEGLSSPLMQELIVTEDKTTVLAGRFLHDGVLTAHMRRGCFVAFLLAVYSARVRVGASTKEAGAHFIEVTREVLALSLGKALALCKTRPGKRVLRELGELCRDEERFGTRAFLEYAAKEAAVLHRE